jgi:gluconokinase
MILIVMGVSGCGKTTIGRLLAQSLGCPFYDGDDFHPADNVAKMASGIPLTDADRAGWLDAIARRIAEHLAQGSEAVFACSALKQAYRQRLTLDPARVRFVYLQGGYELILWRMQQRPGHYMKPGMLQSQFAILEEPADAITVPIDLPPEEIVEQVLVKLSV